MGFSKADDVTEEVTTYGLAEDSGAIFHLSPSEPTIGLVYVIDDPASTQSDGGEACLAVVVVPAVTNFV